MSAPTNCAPEAQKIMEKRVKLMLANTHVPGSSLKERPFGAHVLDQVKLVRVSAGGVEYDSAVDNLIVARDAWAEVECEFIVSKEAANPYNIMHGGAQAYLMDMISSLPLLMLGTKDVWYSSGGVSSAFTCHFLKAIPVGTPIKIISRTLRRGLTTGTTDCKFIGIENGQLYYFGTHDKADISNKVTRKNSKL